MEQLSLIPFHINITNINQARQKIRYDQFIKNQNFNKINKILNYFETFFYPNNLYQNESHGNQSKLEKITSALNNNIFSLKGQIIEIQQEINLTSGLFNSILVLKNDNILYQISFNNISKLFAEKLNQLQYKILVYLINVKSKLINNKGKYKLQFLFINNKSKIFCSSVFTLNDNNIMCNFSKTISSILETKEQKDIKSFKINTSNLNNSSIKSNKSLFNYSVTYEDIISDSNLTQKIHTIKLENKDLASLLHKEVKSIICDVNDINNLINSLNQYNPRVDICGIVINVKKDTKVTSVELVSLIDSNSIKVIHYPNSWMFNPKQKQIFYLTNINLKINKNLEFILENPVETNVKIIGELTDSEFTTFKRFRFNSEKQQLKPILSSIISLLNPTIDRTIRKYLITIKEVIKIRSWFDTDNEGISRFRLFTKCLIDDGSFEAELFIYDDLVKNIYNFDQTTFNNIRDSTKTSKNLIIYQKTNNENLFKANDFEEFYDKEYLIFAVPFSKIGNKQYNNQIHYGTFMNDSEDKNHIIRNIAKNKTFINGDLFYEKEYSTGQYSLVSKPLLKCVYFEEVQLNKKG